MFIDQGYAFNAGDWDFPDAALRGVYARNSVYSNVTGWESFEPALTRAEEADIINIWRCAEPIPPDGMSSTATGWSESSRRSISAEL